jgi:amino acid adenylation domain-containing protein
MPEFGALMRHSLSGSQTQSLSIQERMQEANEEEALHVLLEAFTESLSALMGYAANAIDPESSIAAYGLDSLNAMSCRYWFFQNIGTDVPVFDILGSKSIRALVARVLAKFKGNQSGSGDKAVELPQPTRHGELAIRPLSHSQQRLWFLQSFLTDKSIYNLVLVCHIEGKVDVPAFKQAWTTLLQRHEALHSRLVDTKNGLQQLPTSLSEFPITEVVASEEEFDEKVATITQAARSYVFNFETPELVRGWLLKSPKGWRFFLTSHHIAWDRSSVPTIFAETTSAYKALVAGKPAEVELKPVEYQFIDYTLWQEECLQKSAYLDPLIKYWSDRLEGRPEAVSLLPMALVDKRPAVKQLRTSHVHFSLDVATSQAMRAFCAKHGVTPFMFSACSLSALVHRLTGDADVILGIADGDRGHSAFDNMIGFTVNMLPIRSNHNSKSPFVSILEDYRTACLGAYEHRALPFDYLLSKLEIPRRTSHSPIFQITVNYQVHGSFSEVDYGDFKFVDYDHYNARQQMDLSLGIEEDATGALECDIEFDTALYDEAGMRHLADMYETFVKSVVGSSESTTLGDIRILTANDERFYEELLESQQEDYESIMAECESSLFPVLFDRAVAAKPEKVALLDASKAFTWSDVDKATRKIASELLSCGIIKGASVGLFAEQSTDLVLAAWAIARAGAAYVPLDPDFPDSRIMDMMEDVGMTVCVTDGSNGALARLVGCGLKASHVFNVGQILTATPDTKQDVSLPQVVKEDPFCCVFTSGSTGRPKGIMIGHGPLRYHQESYSREVGLREDDRLLLASAMVFDASLCAIYAGVLKGATVVIAGREARYSANAMVDLIFQHKVSSLLITPTQASFLLATPSNRKRLEQWTSLRSLVLGGEASPTRLLGDLFALNLGAGEARIFNAYGPSESTVSCSITQLSSEHVDRGVVPLGLSQFPSRLYILDENRARVPVGVPGELWVGGPAVNQGYVARPDLTKRAFLPNPFAPGLIYRTGDLFSLSRGGHLVAHGRMSGDRQVKIRGMRVELDEIEVALWEMVQELDGDDIAQVDNLAVVYHKKNNDGSVIAAYIATSKMAIDKSEQAYVRKCLRQSLGDRLPRHMVPSSFVFVDEIPSTVAGKTDYKTMSAWTPPKPDIVMPTNGVNGDHRDVLTPLQLDIAAIWKAVLGLVPDDDTAANDATVQEAHEDVYIGLKDDFFALGGHSLLLMKLQDQLQRKFGVALGLADMFGSPTIAGIQRLLKAHSDWQKAGMEAKYAEQITGGQDGGAVNGLETNGHIETIDWASETTLPADITTLLDKATRTIANHDFQNAGSILITGASSMIGAHFLHHIITRTTLTVYCVAEPVTTHKEAKGRIIDALDYHNLREDCRADISHRIVAFPGQLSHPTLGLTDEEVKLLVERADAIFHLDSDVSLLKNYAGVRAGNVGAVLFLIRLAAGYYASSIPKLRQLKPLHYLSTWGVPHLQVWNATTLSPPDTIIKDEIEMHNMTPSPEPGLAYLKARWACERLLGDAAARGLPVTIFRPSMCANSERSGRGLKTDDINRRILEGSLQTGCVPDFGSEKGGGMSWITVDWLVDSMAQLSSLHQNPDGIDATSKSALQIHHLVADTHLPYTDLAARLETAYDGRKMGTVSPAEWFAALRSTGNVDMAMQASVLESWWKAGWVGFRLQDETTRRELRSRSGPKVKINATATGSESSTDDERGGSPKSGSVSGGSDDFVLVEEAGSGRQRVMERDWIMRCIIGEKGF